jgi:hypothetical protein
MALTLQVHGIARIELSDPNTITFGNGDSFVTRKLTVVDGMGCLTELTLFGGDAKALTVSDPWKDRQDADDIEAFLAESDAAAREAARRADAPVVREHIL